MIVYNVSNTEKPSNDLYHLRECGDLGHGVYVTTDREQAGHEAQHYIKIGETAYLNIFELDNIPPLFTYKRFDAFDGEWLDYVANCRRGTEKRIYDIVEGGIIDYEIYCIVNLYLKGESSREQTVQQLSTKTPKHQICICNPRLAERFLHFVKSVKL